jgi:hypothetical protein
VSHRALTALAASLAATVALAAAAAGARGALVEVRVDTSTGAAPVFDGMVETSPHPVDGGDGSGAHACSGGGATPAPTATGALDDAMRSAGITWHGSWDPSFRDFFVDRIGPYASAPPDDYWSLTVDGHFSPGGCLATVQDGDIVHFEYGPAFQEAESPAPPGGSPTAPGGTSPGGGSPPSPTTHARVRAVAARAARYLRDHADAAGAGWGRLALALRRGGGPERAAAALLGKRLNRQRHDGSLADDVNATATAILATGASQPRRAAAAAHWLAGVQSPDGGFGFRPGLAADVDTTALATWALARAGRRAAAHGGGAFVAATENPDGGFPSFPGGESNAQSTGLALVALRVAGPGPRLASATGATPLDYLASLARPDGSIEYSRGSRPTPAWTTAQALLGLTARGRLLGEPLGLGRPSVRRRSAARNTLPLPHSLRISTNPQPDQWRHRLRWRRRLRPSSSGVARPPRLSTTSPYPASECRSRSCAGSAGSRAPRPR